MLTKKFGPHDSRPENLVSEKHRQALRPWRFGKELPLVSIVIPTYNRSSFLLQAVESILSQTWKNVEIVIVDDGSTDDTREVLAPYMGRIRYIYQSNSGRPSCPRNVGIRNAAGKYIAFLDSDDIMDPRKIEMQVRFLEKNPEVGMVFTDFSTFAHGRAVSQSFTSSGHTPFVQLPKTQVGPNQYILSAEACDCLTLDNPIGTPSVVARKEVFARIGTFDESLRWSDDIDMWFRIAEKFRLGYIDLPLFTRRIHRTNISSNLSTLNEGIVRARILVREKFLKSCVISADTHRQLRRRLANMYCSLAFLQQNEGKRRETIFSLWESINRRPVQFIAYRVLGECMLPTRTREALRRFYVRVKTALAGR